MCGIMGLFTSKITKAKKQTLENSCKLLLHRGPDDSGMYENEKVLFLHKRLSIIDLRGGKQPIENDNFVLISNGEIYNDIEIRKKNLNYNYKTGSDCESILAVYSKYGINGFKRLRGMYAFAIYDKKKKKVILGRDPFGIKPIYYSYNNKELIFSSEIKPILKARDLQIKLKKKKIIELLQLQYTCGRNTIYNKVLRLRPGENIVFDSEISIEKSIVFDKSKNYKKNQITNSKKLEEKLSESVELHQRSDVPFGLFFSGGIDSTVILYLMSKICKKKIISYSILFNSPNQSDEKKRLEQIALKCNSEINFVNFDEHDFWNLLPRVLKANDDPILDYAIVPTFKLAQIASKDVKVILSGEGGDEIFAGYGRHRKIKRLFLKKEVFPSCEFDKHQKFKKKFKDWDFDLNFHKLTNKKLTMSSLQNLQLFDCEEWLPNNLLIKLDRCLMINSLEGRTPLIDIEIFKNFFGVRDNFKIRNGLGKFLLRIFLKEKIPFYDFLHKKVGFTVPINSWIPGKCDLLARYLPKNKLLKKIFEPQEIKSICLKATTNKKFITLVWRLLCLSVWYQVHFDKGLEKQDTFYILSNQD